MSPQVGTMADLRSLATPPTTSTSKAKSKTRFDTARIRKHLPFRNQSKSTGNRTAVQQVEVSKTPLKGRQLYVDVLSAPINIPPEYAPLQYNSSSLIRAKSTSPVDSVISQLDDCPRISRFSWQSHYSKPVTHLRRRSRHIEIVIPEWAGPKVNPPKRTQIDTTPTCLLNNLSRFPSPPSSQSLKRISSHERLRRLEGPRRQTRRLVAALEQKHHQVKPRLALHKALPKPPASVNKPKARKAHRTTSNMADGVMSPATVNQTAGLAAVQPAPTNNLSSLVCNVHRTTGDIPPALVGAATVVTGDRLFVFGGRRLSRRRPQLTQDLYELDLIKRHWSSIPTTGNKPAPRYFHSMCALGDTKLVCYGGMAPVARTPNTSQDLNGEQPQPSEPEIVVMSDVHIYDINNHTWSLVSAPSSPPGRYAHCAAILPSWSVFTSDSANLSSQRSQTPTSSHGGQTPGPDGRGGAEMVVVGGQDGSSHYIEEISIFNLRSMTWTATTELGRSCGAYRSVVAPLTKMRPSQIGVGQSSSSISSSATDDEAESNPEEGYATLIYSNYNFLDVKLELQVRHADGRMFEKQMTGAHSPPGLRFPNGEVLSHHFIVSGTFLTSTRQEYALWALNLKTLTWFRIDVGPGILTSGSWNRGILWRKRNTFVVLGDRRRNLAEDYNHRRLNFSNMCTVELEAFGLYENPVATAPAAGFDSASSPLEKPFVDLPIFERPAKSDVGQDLGRLASDMREIADMDFLAIGGERISVNFHIIARRWGPYLAKLLDGLTTPSPPQMNGSRTETSSVAPSSRNDSVTSTSTITYPSRSSSMGFAVPNPTASFSNTVSSALDDIAASRPSIMSTSSGATGLTSSSTSTVKPTDPEFASALTTAATSRPRLLYLPHTFLTLRALVHYLYTWTLPPVNTPLCTPQVLCSLLQIARPYRINGLLESVVQRLHEGFEGRSTAAVFNAAAMAAGGMQGVAFAADRREVVSPNPDNPSGDSSIPTDSNSQAASSATGTLSGASAARQAQRDAGMTAAKDVSDSEDRARGAAGAAAGALTKADGSAQSSTTNFNQAASTNAASSTNPTTAEASTTEDETSSIASSNSSQGSTSTSFSSTGGSQDGRPNTSNAAAGTTERAEPKIWDGSFSSVVGLQKRGLRGLMEGRALRERLHGAQRPAAGSVGTDDAPVSSSAVPSQSQSQNQGQTYSHSQNQAYAQQPPTGGARSLPHNIDAASPTSNMHQNATSPNPNTSTNLPVLQKPPTIPSTVPSALPTLTNTSRPHPSNNMPGAFNSGNNNTLGSPSFNSPPGTALSGASSGVGGLTGMNMDTMASPPLSDASGERGGGYTGVLSPSSFDASRRAAAGSPDVFQP